MVRDDHRAFLTWLLSDRPDLRVGEAYSRFERDLLDFATADAALAFMEAQGGTAYLMLRLPAVADAEPRRIDLDASTGHRFRYCREGWALMQLQLKGATADGIGLSYFAHNQPACARRKASG